MLWLFVICHSAVEWEGALVSPDGVVPSQMVGVSPGWSWKKGLKTVVMLLSWYLRQLH